jgi:hypothetical protein
MVTQAQNAVWSVGATVSPFIIKPFLVELVSSHNQLITSAAPSLFYDYTTATFSRAYNSTWASYRDVTRATAGKIPVSTELPDAISSFATGLVSVQVTENLLPEGADKVRYAHLLIGILALLTALPMMNFYFYVNGLSIPFRTQRHASSCNAKKLHSPLPMFPKPPCPAVCYTIVVVLVGFLYGGLESTPRTFLPSLAVRRLSWSVGDAAILLSVFYGTFCLGRLIAVSLSMVISTAISLVLNIFFAGIGFGLLLLLDFVDDVSPVVVWISSGFVGFGLSSTFASLVLLVIDVRHHLGEQWLSTSTLLTALCVGCQIGFVVFPSAVGNMFDRLSPMWVVYAMTGATVLLAGLLIVRRISARFLEESVTRYKRTVPII